MKKILSLALAVVMALGLAVPALAYTTPDFSDLPSDNWAYAPVMRMADLAYIQGTGEGKFSPSMKVSAAQFLTLVGRIVFPETVVGANDTWYGPYVAAAQSNGLLTRTQVDPAAPEAEITRYDMAVILRAAAKELGKAETLAQQSQVTDYGMVPTMYADAVLAVYGMGLITGDQNGNFNGSNTMMRNELATVIDRLVALKAPEDSTTEPETPVESPASANPDDDWQYAVGRKYVISPYDPDAVELKQGKSLHIYTDFMTPDDWGRRGKVYLHVGDTLQLTVDEVPSGYNYTKDDVQWSSWDETIAIVDEHGFVTVVGDGKTSIVAEVPVIYYGDTWITTSARVTLYCEGK